MSASSMETTEREIFIPAAQGRAFTARASEYLTLIDVEGQQIGDFVALTGADHRERLSTCYTRTMLRRIYAGQGDQLFTNRRRPILTIVEDAIGRHDLTIAACDARHYAQRFDLPDHPNCLDNLSAALAPYGIEEWQVPEPLNIWQNTMIGADGHYDYAAPLTEAGTRIVLQAEMDMVERCPPARTISGR